MAEALGHSLLQCCEIVKNRVIGVSAEAQRGAVAIGSEVLLSSVAVCNNVDSDSVLTGESEDGLVLADSGATHAVR